MKKYENIIMRTKDNAVEREVPEAVLKAKQRFSIIGNSPALINAIERAVKVAAVDLSVLVTGESGSGKEFFPKIIHNLGPRKHKKYIAVNCGAIPEGTIDSELFGHEKGSFTGAVATRKGYFEEADGGTVFLDEVAELPLTTQARLLRVLESGEFLKVGSSEVQKTDVRIVAATNVDLLRAVAEGKFREDLYYRLSTVTITVEEASRAMMLYRWPGNVRQLKNVIEQLALFYAGEEISRRQLSEILPASSSADTAICTVHRDGPDRDRDMLWQAIFAMKNEIASLRDELGRCSVPAQGQRATAVRATELPGEGVATTSLVRYEDAPVIPSLASTLENSERELVVAALRRNGGNKSRAAEDLNISTRTLYRKIREYGIDETFD